MNLHSTTAALATVLSALVISLPGFARNSCVEVFDSAQQKAATRSHENLLVHALRASSFELEAQDFGANEVSYVTTHLRRAARLFEKFDGVPDEIYIRPGRESQAGASIGLIELALKPGPSEKNGRATDRIPKSAVIVHEFTHLVFHHALKMRLSELLGEPKILETLEALNNKVYDEQFGPGPVSPALLAEQKRVQELLNEREQTLGIKADTDLLDTLSLEEVMGDFAAAVYLDQPSAVSHGLMAENIIVGQEAKFRDLGKRVPVKGWSREAAHHLYTPTRSYLGQKLSKQLSLIDKQRLLKNVFDTLVDELLVLTREKSRGISNNPEFLNRRLIDRLDSALTDTAQSTQSR